MFVSDPYVIVDIKSLSYDDIECVSSNLDIASCRVDKDKLYIKAIGKGEAEIRVISKEYGEVSYKLNSYSSSLDIIPDYYCLQSKRKEIINLGYIYDNVEVSNNKLLSKAYIEGNLLYIEGEGVTGREELIIRSNGVEKKFIIDMVGLTIPSIGTVINVGGVSSADIIARNTQKLSCEVPDSSIAECYIENNKVYVRGLKRGEVNLRITNTSSFNGKSYECGETQFLVVVR